MDQTFATCLVLVLAAASDGCAVEPARAASSEPAQRVEVVHAERGERPIVTEVVGSVRAVRSTTMAALISGTVVEIHAGLGSSVRAGQVLVKLSVPEIAARLEQTRAVAALATVERDRAVSLRSRAVISGAEYDAAISQSSVAEARRAEAMAMADHAVLRAPFTGVVAAKLANVGDTALPGQPLLILESPAAFRFEAQVPEAVAAGGVALGAPVPVRLDGLDRDIQGTIAEIQPAADEATRTRLIKVALPALPGLRSGRFGRLLLATGAAASVSVPADAVVRRGQLESVFVVSSGIARLRLVRSGREHDGRLEIASGLSGDEPIVLAGAAALVDGQRVEVVP